MEDLIKNLLNETIDNELNQLADKDNIWLETPVTPKVFFEEWLKQPLYPEQLKAIESIFTNDSIEWSRAFTEYLLLWGEGSGKDFICTRIVIYVAYWLMCLKNPQGYFKLAKDEPIDIVNVSVSGPHAKDVFFKRLVSVIRNVKDPKNGKNWFLEKGMDLRDNKDIQTTKINFKNSITAYSLNSVKYTGEGKNIILAIFDEVAEFKPHKAKELYDNLWHTASSRYGREAGSYFKIFLISYMRNAHDFMMYRWEQTKKNSKGIYRSCKSTWEVNLGKTKGDFKEAYAKDPEGSARRYENKLIGSSSNTYIKFPERIILHANSKRTSPFLNNPLHISNLLDTTLQSWFLPGRVQEMIELEKSEFPGDKEKLNILKLRHQGAEYFVHIDLAKGNEKQGNCAVGFAVVHLFPINPENEDSNYGVYVDMAIQIKDKKEVDFEHLRKFIYKLEDMGFQIAGVSLDGYQSVDFIQRLRDRGIEAKTISVDRDNSAYDSVKELIYTKKLDYYKYPILMRELKELIITTNGKIDHPEISNERSLLEGNSKGSKDVSDSIAGAVANALGHKPEDTDWFSVL